MNKQNTAQKILETAARLYGEKGADAVGMRELAREAGVMPNTITHHFKSKANLRRMALAYALEYGVPMNRILARHPVKQTTDSQKRADQLGAMIVDLVAEVTDSKFEPFARMITHGIVGTDTEQKRLLLDAFNRIEVGFIEFLEALGVHFDDMQLRFFTYYLWSQVLFLSASQDMVRVDLQTEEVPPEFLIAFSHEIARICCLTVGLPEPLF